MKAQAIGTRVVRMVYLIVVAGACLFALSSLYNKIGYRQIYERIGLQVTRLTEIAGALIVFGSFIGGRQNAQA